MTILKAPPHSFNRNTCVLGGILFPLNTGLIKKRPRLFCQSAILVPSGQRSTSDKSQSTQSIDL